MASTATTVEGLIAAGLVYENESRYVDDGLAFDYILESGTRIARVLHDGDVADIAYQPGDGTFYGLVFVPLRHSVTAPPRVKDGVEWDRLAIRGIAHRDEHAGRFVYDDNAYLVVWVEHAAYPFRLGNRADLAADYVGEKLDGGSGVSAVSLSILLRAISASLDTIRGTV